MDVKMCSPFIEACFDILPQFGLQELKKGKIGLKEDLIITMGVTALVGLTDGIHGNVAYSMAEDTAKKIASMMMMGMPVPEFDAMAQSAVAEMANMITANAATKLESNKFHVDISPPTLLFGENTKVRTNPMRTLVFEVLTNVGTMEVKIGIEG